MFTKFLVRVLIPQDLNCISGSQKFLLSQRRSKLLKVHILLIFLLTYQKTDGLERSPLLEIKEYTEFHAKIVPE